MRTSSITVGSRSRKMHRGTCFPAPVSEKNVLNASSDAPIVLSLGICPLAIEIGQSVSRSARSTKAALFSASRARRAIPEPPARTREHRARGSRHPSRPSRRVASPLARRTPAGSRVRGSTTPSTSSRFAPRLDRCEWRSPRACRLGEEFKVVGTLEVARCGRRDAVDRAGVERDEVAAMARWRMADARRTRTVALTRARSFFTTHGVFLCNICRVPLRLSRDPSRRREDRGR